ncbi:hypothetical protein FSP39_019298 [Pinctada imbricata]|uniref:Uncharacterized protein n=1 Tax=Pinctada imbricata TaxID=66713 RepID=A0AA89C702_PINIB|nr:hypothetical protein FSP39_019298 [Pinctada imbricata]
MIAICLDLMGIFAVIAPHSPNVELMWFLFVMQGTFEGVINIAGQKLILELWREKASSPMHALHFGFGIGSFIVPLIANPFLAVPDYINLQNTTNASLIKDITTTTLPDLTTIVYVKESRIEWPFLIVGVIAVAESLLFHYYQFFGKDSRNPEIINVEKQSKAKSLKEIIDPATCASGNRFYGLSLFFLLFLYFFQATGGERIYGKFIRAFAIDHFGMDGDEASLLNTEFWISFSAGRFLGFILAICIPIRILIVLECTGGLISAVLLNIFARDNSLALWILTVPMGIFIAPCFPSGVGWGDYHVKMTGFGITFLLLGGALGGVAYMWVIGHFYDSNGPLTLFYMLIAYSVPLCLFAFLLNIISCGKGNRFKEEENELEVVRGKDEKKFDSITGPPDYSSVVPPDGKSSKL